MPLSRVLERVRTPVLWRTVPWLFFSVVIIQLCGLFPLVQSHRETLYAERAKRLKARVETAFHNPGDPQQELQLALHDRGAEVIGLGLYDASGAVVAAFGRPPPAKAATSLEPELEKVSPRVWEVRWQHMRGGAAHTVSAAIDVSREAEQVKAFIALAGLLTIPSALVVTASGAAILLFGIILPLRRLRDELLGRVEPEKTDAASDADDGYDELAQVRTLVNRLDEARAAAREAERRADLANRAKDEFLANMSHELRSPLASIVSHADILLELTPDGGGSFGKDLKKIKGSARHVSDLVGQILTLSKFEAGRMVADPTTFEVRAAVEATVGMIEGQIEQNGNKLVVEVAPDVTTMHSDELKVRQILLNILANAAKFTSQGTIRMAVRSDGAEGAAWLVFTISDTGIGMTEEQLRKVFEPFVQADGSTTRLYGGTGLGLSISDRLCRILGGRIQATSAVDRGSTFTIWLPARVPAEHP